MVVQRSHSKNTLVRKFEDADLDDIRKRRNDVEPTDQNRKELSVGQDLNTGDGRTNGLRAGVAHEDLGGRGIPP